MKKSFITDKKIYFEKVQPQHKDIIFQWLDEPHVKEFWDNSPNHRNDILIFIDGRKKRSSYWGGVFTYWIGSIHNKPYCFLLTAPCVNEEDYPELWRKYLSKTGVTYTIDFCIGNKEFLGKGLAAPTLASFTEFFQSQVDHNADTFFIDPDIKNPRAKHVYEKAGFTLVGDFVMQEGVFDGSKTYLLVKKLKPRISS